MSISKNMLLVLVGCGSAGNHLGPDAGTMGPSDSAMSTTLALGFYDVTSDQRDDGCTGTLLPTSGGAPMFEVYAEAVSGTTFDFIHSCATTSQCPADSDPFIAQFLLPDGSGWSGSTYAAIVLGNDCKLIRFGGRVTASGTTLQVDLERDELLVTGGASSCDGMTAQQHASQLVCVQRRAIAGVPHA